MSGLIATARAEILADLAAIAPVHSVLPATLTPPAIIAAEGSPFCEPGDTPGSYRVTFEIQCFAQHSANPIVALDNLDALVDRILALYPRANVATYQTATLADGQPRLAARLTVQSSYTVNP